MATAVSERRETTKTRLGKQHTAEGFTTKASMKNVTVNQHKVIQELWVMMVVCCWFFFQVVGPPKAGAYKERPAKPTSFRKFYDRGDFPIALEHDTKGNKIAWKVRKVSLSLSLSLSLTHINT